MKLYLKIAVPGSIIWEGEANEISVQTITGKIGILPNHISILSVIETSILVVKSETTKRMVISDGYISVENNQVFIATDRCFLEENITKEKIDKKYTEILEKIKQADKPTKKAMANKALKRVNCCYNLLNLNKNI